MFVPADTSTFQDIIDILTTLLPQFTPDGFATLEAAAYPDPALVATSNITEDHDFTGTGIGDQFGRLEQAYGHFAHLAPVKQFLHSNAPSPSSSSYLCHLAVNGSFEGGADHGIHVSYLTYNVDVRYAASIEKVAGSIHAYWTSFIVRGEPNVLRGKRFSSRIMCPRWNGSGRVQMRVFCRLVGETFFEWKLYTPSR
ncbi:hypothetical protein BJ878DRAFT_95888 [Calycina marina]|uniref:Uncharacterized protein n=1 Tax=Calycina marina TaxID=1763456 RepID=A0A9P8CER4_9HELO|nr:hypothetical protein BJ878DRAFT_95888 [Calycina marina]